MIHLPPRPAEGMDFRNYPWGKWWDALWRASNITVEAPLEMSQHSGGTNIRLGHIAPLPYAIFDSPDGSSGTASLFYRTLKSVGGIWTMDDNGDGTKAELTVSLAADFEVTITAHGSNDSSPAAAQVWMEKFNGVTWDVVALSLIDFPELASGEKMTLEKTFPVTTTAGGIYRVQNTGSTFSLLMSGTGGGAGSLWKWKMLPNY